MMWMAQILSRPLTFGRSSKGLRFIKTPAFLFLFLATAVVCFCKPDFTWASTNIEKALKLGGHQPEKALKIFESIKPSDPHYKVAIEELLKIHYRAENWPSFFAHAQYYRKRWSRQDLADVFLLEILALLRHCQNEVVFSLTDAFRKSHPHLSPTFDQMNALARTRFKGKASKTSAPHGLIDYMRGKTRWPLKHSKIDRFKLKELRVKVENQCPQS